MVSAVFHSPTGGKTAPVKRVAATEAELAAATAKANTQMQRARQWNNFWMAVLPPLMGLGLLIGIWTLVSITTKGSIPSPYETGVQAIDIFSDPFYRKGPNDQGVGWNVLMSLERVAVGFGLAALVGIPAGFVIGRFTFLSRMFNPLISLLRPVSPLAWLPIGLLVFKGANPAAIWTIFICSIWPMIINTAVSSGSARIKLRMPAAISNSSIGSLNTAITLKTNGLGFFVGSWLYPEICWAAVA